MLGVVIDIGRSRVVGRPHVGDRCFTSYLLETYVDELLDHWVMYFGGSYTLKGVGTRVVLIPPRK
jgi:hypothetical protein